MAKGKLHSGEGWSFIPAGGDKKAERESLPPEKQRPKISLEKRAGGKVVTVIANVVLSDADRKALARELKQACGGGGTDREDSIELQGDHRETAKAHLVRKGWPIK